VWLATPIALARAPIDPGAKLQCVSYAPFRGEQTPLQSTAQIPPEQIARTWRNSPKYPIACELFDRKRPRSGSGPGRESGLKVIQGSGSAVIASRTAQISTVVADQSYRKSSPPSSPATSSVAREMTARPRRQHPFGQSRLPSGHLRHVWEFWLRNRDVYDAVDFVTIHICLIGGLPDPGEICRSPCRLHSQADGGGVPGQGNPDR